MINVLIQVFKCCESICFHSFSQVANFRFQPLSVKKWSHSDSLNAPTCHIKPLLSCFRHPHLGKRFLVFILSIPSHNFVYSVGSPLRDPPPQTPTPPPEKTNMADAISLYNWNAAIQATSLHSPQGNHILPTAWHPELHSKCGLTWPNCDSELPRG